MMGVSLFNAVRVCASPRKSTITRFQMFIVEDCRLFGYVRQSSSLVVFFPDLGKANQLFCTLMVPIFHFVFIIEIINSYLFFILVSILVYKNTLAIFAGILVSMGIRLHMVLKAFWYLLQYLYISLQFNSGSFIVSIISREMLIRKIC